MMLCASVSGLEDRTKISLSLLLMFFDPFRHQITDHLAPRDVAVDLAASFHLEQSLIEVLEKVVGDDDTRVCHIW